MIRHATLLDKDDILAMAAEFYPTTSYAKWADFDEETVLLRIENIIKTGIMLVAQEEDRLVGFLAAMGVPFLFNSGVIQGVEVCFWVNAEYRKSGVGKDLLRRADQLRVLRGWKAFQMVRLEESSASLDALYISEGFQPTEHCFTKVN